MTVRQLIEDLKHCDPDSEVLVAALPPGGYRNIDNLRKTLTTANVVDSLEEIGSVVVLWKK